MTIAVYTHADCLRHDPGPGHPESPDRLRVILDEMRASRLAADLAFAEAPVGTWEQILLAHQPEHPERIRAAAPASGLVALDGDTLMSPGSLDAALRAVGAACQAVDDLLDGRFAAAFCATRPPGHHATPQRAMGFCLFNHIAIAALYARHERGLDRVAIVDFDVHHGNGSQDILEGRQGLLYISTHQSPLYPGSGGRGENIEGNILNIPLPGGTAGEDYRKRFAAEVEPALDAFRPQLLLASAGFDAHRRDPLAGLALTEEDYRWIGGRLKAAASRHCQGRLLSVLEGGYNLEALGPSATAYLEGQLD